MTAWKKIKRYFYIDTETQEKYAEQALAFERKTLLIFMYIILVFFPFYGSALFLINQEKSITNIVGLGSTFIFSLFTYICIRSIHKKGDQYHVHKIRNIYSIIVTVYLYIIGTFVIETSYIIIYMVLFSIAMTYIDPKAYKLLILFSLIIPEVFFCLLGGITKRDTGYYLLDTLVVTLVAVVVNQLYAMDRYHLFALESGLRSERDIDGLTGLFNQRYFHEVLKQHQNMNTVACVVLIDLDHFKEVNDTLGHKQGDLVVQKTAEILNNVFQKNDFLSRIGGDEFAAFLTTEMTQTQMKELLQEKICALQEMTPIIASKDGNEVKVTFSIGACIRIVDNDNSLEELLTVADTAMYEIKSSTRNGACLYVGDAPAFYLYPMK